MRGWFGAGRKRQGAASASFVPLSLLLSAGLWVCASVVVEPAALAQPAQGEVRELRVLTFNVWHGLRSGESNRKFPGEDPERQERRLEWQIEQLRRLDPDVLLLQEVNPAKGLALRYAEALGYDVLYKTTSCGFHLGAIYKIPRNMNEGLAILARPELGLRSAGKKRLSGNARCSASWGIQTKESRYALFGEITVGGRRVLLATTHLSSPAFLLPDFEEKLAALEDEGVITPEQRQEILAARDRKDRRNLEEAERLVEQIETRRTGRSIVVLGGDFNAMPDSPSVQAVRAAGLEEVGSGPDFYTWDPVVNSVNQEIGGRRTDPLPSFGREEVSELFAHREVVSRQIDHLFFAGSAETISATVVLNEARDGILPSDHFGLMATLGIGD